MVLAIFFFFFDAVFFNLGLPFEENISPLNTSHGKKYDIFCIFFIYLFFCLSLTSYQGKVVVAVAWSYDVVFGTYMLVTAPSDQLIYFSLIDDESGMIECTLIAALHIVDGFAGMG